jgi:hypothetical protein
MVLAACPAGATIRVRCKVAPYTRLYLKRNKVGGKYG